jgi:hypothetical protein
LGTRDLSVRANTIVIAAVILGFAVVAAKPRITAAMTIVLALTERSLVPKRASSV